MSHFNDQPVPVPYHSKLSGPIEEGQTLFVHGNIHEDATRFEINFLQNTDVIDETKGSVLLHLSVRFDDKKIVLNSLENGEWQKEQRVSNPYKPGDEFDLRIRVYEDHFEVLAEQKELTKFKHRQSYRLVDHLQVKGDINITGLHWGGRVYTLPHEVYFPFAHLRNDDRILIHGVPNGSRFEVDLINDKGDILFHFNPRFNEKTIVRNALQNGEWGNEEREGPFPFKKGQEFDLIIQNKDYSIQLFVNNERIGTFAHRGNPNEYTKIKVDGEVELTGIEYAHFTQ